MSPRPKYVHYRVHVQYMHGDRLSRTERLEIFTTDLMALMEMRQIHEKFMRLLPEVLDGNVLKSN